MNQQSHFPHYSNSLIERARQLRKNMTDAERLLWKHLRRDQLGCSFRRQFPFDYFILDFYCHQAKLVIEVDGGQHYTEEGKEKDRKRDAELSRNGLRVLRFSDRDVLLNIEGVLQMIVLELERHFDAAHAKSEPTPL